MTLAPDLGERVGKVEQRIDHMERQIDEIVAGVKKLVERDAARPEGLSLKTIAATCGGLGAIAIVVWWLISTAPVILELRERVLLLDSPGIGRVHVLSERVSRLEESASWAPKVTAAR